MTNEHLPNVSKQFIDENKEYGQKKVYERKKGGPYAKQERIKKQNEVFRLHFEWGYSAVKISDILKLHRNTVNSYINFWYSKLRKDWNSYDIDSWCMKQFYRFETQRTRLLEDLGKQKNQHEKNSIQKLVFEIDSRMTNLIIKLYSTDEKVIDRVVTNLNDLTKKQNIDATFFQSWDLTRVSAKTGEKIKKLLANDLQYRISRS